MSDAIQTEIDQFMEGLRKRNPHETEFHQAVEEVVDSIMPWYLERDHYRKAELLERLTEPDRIISFCVTWETDAGEIRANRAWRVQFCNALGPYKGGLRFDPSVTQSVLKFLGFEQIFKNSLTGLPMGGAKGGANFNPKGKSEREIMRFCHGMMIELQRHIGEDVDVPAGDIGVGAREISYLFGKYVSLQNRWTGVLTGKGLAFGGSAVRKEATGYGAMYFCRNMLEHHDQDIKGKRVAISGSGNVAIYAAEKAPEMGASVLSVSDSGGTLYFPRGMTADQLQSVKDVKEVRRGRCEEVADQYDDAEFHKGKNPWSLDCDIAVPCATQNEMDLDDAKALKKTGVIAVVEGANMPTTADALHFLAENDIMHAPGKASNAGGVGVSGLEQSQNAQRIAWSHEEVEARLQEIMRGIHRRCVEHGENGEVVDYVKGANIAGFSKVADALYSYGVVVTTSTGISKWPT
ncbi:MAG: NADP-specific glutamate dehydrogenase [Gammaproteobacteria bacterium]|nr:NADP-specific glutamate dehydrogenase [Gammaproteobacteria bacterium]